jgi:hypothetical protein
MHVIGIDDMQNIEPITAKQRVGCFAIERIVAVTS